MSRINLASPNRSNGVAKSVADRARFLRWNRCALTLLLGALLPILACRDPEPPQSKSLEQPSSSNSRSSTPQDGPSPAQSSRRSSSDIDLDSVRNRFFEKPSPGLPRPTDRVQLNVNDVTDRRLTKFAEYCRDHDVIIRHRESAYWRVIEPKIQGYELEFGLGTFPNSAAENEMRRALGNINLAYSLNAEAHIAMSFPGLQGVPADVFEKNPDAIRDITESEEYKALVAKVADLFLEYRP